MNTAQSQFVPIVSHTKANGEKWTVKEKIFLGLEPGAYFKEQFKNPFNWILWVIYAVGLPVLVGRFIFGLGWATHGSYD